MTPSSRLAALLCLLGAPCLISPAACVHYQEREQEKKEARVERPPPAERPRRARRKKKGRKVRFDDAFLASGKKRYSERKEELIIRHFFQDKKKGFFVDIGCYHPKDFSTTYYLEKHLGWSGIGVDALPEFEPLYRKLRPRTRFFNYIVTDHSGGMETLHVAGPLSSTSPDWLDHFQDEKTAKTIRVPTITMNELLNRNGVMKIDFLSMDIELGEPAALAGFDIERFRPSFICIEASLPNRKFLSDYFEEHGYELLEKYIEHDILNWYFRPREDEEKRGTRRKKSRKRKGPRRRQAAR